MAKNGNHGSKASTAGSSQGPSPAWSSVFARFRRGFPGFGRSLVAGLTFGLALAAGVLLVGWLADGRQAEEKRTAAQHAERHGAAVTAQIRETAGAVYAMEALVRAAGGIPGAFQARAEEILHRHPPVATLELQPGGVGARVAPLEGNEDALGYDALADPETGAMAQRLVDERILGVVAPTRLQDGRQGPAIRLPVFFPPTGDGGQFWGFVSAGLHLDHVLERAGRPELEEMGYRYSLQVVAAGDESRAVAGLAPGELIDPVEWGVDVPGSGWIVALEPGDGWGSPLLVVRDSAMVLLAALLLAFLAGGLETLRSARARIASAAREASMQRSLLDTVLGSTEEGVAAFDPDLRLQDFNPRWGELRAYPEELVQAGRPLADFIRYDAERGLYGEGNADELTRQEMERTRAGDPPAGSLVLPEGRVVEVRGAVRSGGGLVETVSDVTSEHRARERLRVLFEGTSDGYFLVRGAVVVDCNSAALALTGDDTREEVLGADLPEHLGGESDGEWLRELLERARREGESRSVWTVRRQGLEPLPLEVMVRPMDSVADPNPLLLVVLHDLRGRRRVERAEEVLKGVFEHSSALISVKDLEGRYLMVNAEWERVLGISRDNALRQREGDLFAAEVALERQRVDQQAAETKGPVTVEEQIWVGGRARKFVTVALPIMGRQGRPEAVCRISNDVTELEDLRTELKELGTEMEGLRSELAEVRGRVEESDLEESEGEELEPGGMGEEGEGIASHASTGPQSESTEVVGEVGSFPSETLEVMEELRELVQSGDTKAVELVDRLQAELAGTHLSESADRVAEFVRNYQFEGARLALKILREELAAAEKE